MNKAIGKKRTVISLLFAFISLNVVTADNEVYIDQSGATSNLDIEQVGGGGNIIGGSDATAGASNMTPLDLDGATMTLDILQKGASNKFLGDIWADTYTGYFSFIGDSNTFNMSTDETNATGADGSNVNVQVTGNTNTMTLNLEVKSNLAKLLANENITIQHNKVKTASFDVKNRVLTLPLFKQKSGDVYDMLIAHECAHALWTPYEEWKGIDNDELRSYVNVLEDCRIDLLLQAKYPGVLSN